jgi:hypothetical protein
MRTSLIILLLDLNHGTTSKSTSAVDGIAKSTTSKPKFQLDESDTESESEVRLRDKPTQRKQADQKYVNNNYAISVSELFTLIYPERCAIYLKENLNHSLHVVF